MWLQLSPNFFKFTDGALGASFSMSLVATMVVVCPGNQPKRVVPQMPSLSRLLAGSSRRMAEVWVPKAKAKANRCCCPELQCPKARKRPREAPKRRATLAKRVSGVKS